MKLIGLTGGIGMGKSTSADWLSRSGIPVVDTDLVARELVEPGQPSLAELAAAFGKDILTPNGALDRGALARKVFSDETLRRTLESILHPRIRERWLLEVEKWKRENRSLGVVVIPLLFETGAEAYFDQVICTACLPETQRERLVKRGWSTEESIRRIQAQWPIEQKIARARFVVWTEGSLDVHSAQWKRILSLSGVL
jgi:dephospho-CoA kinase